MTQRVYIPHKGGSIYGIGDVRKTVDSDNSKFKYVFENKTGKVFFNSYFDKHIDGIHLMFRPQQIKGEIK